MRDFLKINTIISTVGKLGGGKIGKKPTFTEHQWYARHDDLLFKYLGALMSILTMQNSYPCLFTSDLISNP